MMKKKLGVVILGVVIVLSGCRSDVEKGIQAEYGMGGQDRNSQEQRVLTLWTCDAPWELVYAVEAYNAKKRNYYVKIVDYLQEYSDYDTAQERLKLDLGTTKGTDLIWIGDLVADELGYAGVLENLNTYLTPETKEKYLDNILQCAQTGDALYEIAGTFELGFLAGDGGKLGTGQDWTVEEMLEIFRANNKDANALGGVGINTAQELVLHAIEDFIDWDSGKVDFCNQEFYNILEFSSNEKGWVKATPESVASDTHLAVRCGLSDVSDIQYTDWLLGDNWVVKGWPCNNGTGVKVSFYNSFAICAGSKCPEGAWDFLEYYMTLEWLEDYAVLHPELPQKTYQSIHGLPLNRAAFDKMLEWSMVQQYYDTGEPVPLYFGEGEIPDFYANSEKDVEKIRGIVALANRRALSNRSFVNQIIGEEIGGYKAGSLSAEQTAEKIQNRLQVYLNEQR